MVWGMGDNREMEKVAPPWRSSRPSERQDSGSRGRVSAVGRNRPVQRRSRSQELGAPAGDEAALADGWNVR